MKKVLRKIKSVMMNNFITYLCVIGSFLLGRCSFAKMNAFICEYTSYKSRSILNRIGIKFSSPTHYDGKKILTIDETNKFIGDAIEHGKPLMVARFGDTELDAMWRTRDDKKGFIAPMNQSLNDMIRCSGFFPEDKNLLIKFAELMKWSVSQLDLMAVRFIPMEKYFLRNYGKNLEYCNLASIEPYFSTCPWSAKLEGKKVLLIHPFYKSIPYQYEHNRELIWPGTNILPKFELIMQRAVQTVVGTKDPRFNNWFEAFDYMYNEAMSKDFDVAIIGCGAYGFPLAAKLRAAGKITIHLGGATQILFGVKGRRWELMDNFTKMFNENWIRPSKEETPENSKNLGGGCYW